MYTWWSVIDNVYLMKCYRQCILDEVLYAMFTWWSVIDNVYLMNC